MTTEPAWHLLLKDEGCVESPTCLECPLPQCKLDDPRWYRRLLRQRKDLMIIASIDTKGHSKGPAVAEAAARFGITERTVYRVIARNRG